MPPTPNNNAEIDQALKEFESKSNQPQSAPTTSHPINAVITPQTSPLNQGREVEGVKFETDTETYRAIKFYRETVEPKMVKAVIKFSGGAVKDQRQAEWVLLGVVIVFMGMSIYLFFFTGNSNSSKYNNIPLGQPITKKINNL